MSQAYIPGWGADVDISDEELEKMAKLHLERASLGFDEPENSEDYDITYRRKNEVYVPEHCSTWYDFDEIDIESESNINEVSFNLLTGETKVETSEGNERQYNLLSSNDESTTMITELGEELFGIRYTGPENLKGIQLTQDAKKDAKCVEMGEELALEVRTLNYILSDVQQQFRSELEYEKDKYSFTYTENLQDALEECDSCKDTFESKIEDKISSLNNLNVKPHEAFESFSTDWKPLLKMKIGSDRRAVLIDSSKIPDNVQDTQNTIIGLGAYTKQEEIKTFSSGGTGNSTSNKHRKKKNGLHYAINILNGEKDED